MAGRACASAGGVLDVKLLAINGEGLGAGIEGCSGWVGQTQNRVGSLGFAGSVRVGSDCDGDSNTDGAEGEDGEDGGFHCDKHQVPTACADPAFLWAHLRAKSAGIQQQLTRSSSATATAHPPHAQWSLKF